MGDARGVTPMSMVGNVAESWKLWRARFENYLKATEMDKKSEPTKCAQLLHYIGEEGYRIFTTFEFETDEKDKLPILLEKYEAHFLPKENTSFERYRFFSWKQQQGQTFEQFVTDLRQQARKCKFEKLESDLIKCMIICGGLLSNDLRERLLQDDSRSLQDVIQYCTMVEKSKERSTEVTGASNGGGTSGHSEVNAVNRGYRGQQRRTRSPYTRQQQGRAKEGWSNRPKPSSNEKCQRCGRTHEVNRCPAYGKSCNLCKSKNHFAIMCRKKDKGVNAVETELGELCVGSISQNRLCNSQSSSWDTELVINGKKFTFKLDTGAMCNVIPIKYFEMLKLPPKSIRENNVVLRSYTGGKLDVRGVINVMCHRGDVKYLLEFYVVRSETPAILGLATCQQLKLINRVDSVQASEYEQMIHEYEGVFKGIGCIKKPYHIKLVQNARPVAHPTRRVPIPLRSELRQHLTSLEKQGIIKPAKETSDWVNPLVLVKKPDGSIRVCLDPQDLNAAIVREHCYIPTLDEITSHLEGAQFFSTLDACSGFYQIQLDKESSKLCTFGTPFGRFRFCRLPYGIKSAPEVFQERFREIFNFKGVNVYIDDIIVWGKSKKEHDERLKKVLETAREQGIKFNLGKCKFGQSEIKYLGHRLSSKGIEPDDSKVEAIKKMPSPKSKQDVQRLLGMLTYVSKFIPNFSGDTSQLRQLLKKDVEFEWKSNHEEALNVLKNKLTQSPVLQFFRVEKPITVSVDSSKDGLGAVLLQGGLPCAYASKALTETQQRYAQIEKEFLAVCFGLERFHDYIYGKSIVVETDHLPLVPIVRKPLNKCPARLQRMLIQVQKYQFNLVYKPGKLLILADALSRAFPKREKGDEVFENDLEAQVCLIKSQINVTETKLAEIREKTDADQTLRKLKEVIRVGWPSNVKKLADDVKIYCRYKDELTIIEEIVFKGQAMVIPTALRKEMLNRVHYSHLGMNNCVRLAKDAIFWPSMTNEINQMISNCHVCVTYSKSKQPEPIQSHEFDLIPWNKVGCDLFQVRGRHFLIVVDYYSKYVEYEELRETTSLRVVKSLKTMFARHGIPKKVVSDGGPQFDAQIYQNFAREWGFEFKYSSPTYAQSNGLAERNVQTVKNIIKKTALDNRDIDLAMLQYRNTPLSGTYSPAQILMSRKLRTNIPCLNSQLEPKVVDVRKYNTQLSNRQTKTNYYYNRKAKVQLEFEIGQKVYVQARPKANWLPGVVVDKYSDRRYKISLENGSVLVRNSHFIKRLGDAVFKSHEPLRVDRKKKGEEKMDLKYYIEVCQDVDDSHTYNEHVENTSVCESLLSGDENSIVSPEEQFETGSSLASESDDLDSESSYGQKANTPQHSSSGRTVKPPDRLNL